MQCYKLHVSAERGADSEPLHILRVYCVSDPPCAIVAVRATGVKLVSVWGWERVSQWRGKEWDVWLYSRRSLYEVDEIYLVRKA